MISKIFLKWSARGYFLLLLGLWADGISLDLGNMTHKIRAFHVLFSIFLNGLLYFIPIVILIWVGWFAFKDKQT